MSSTFETSEKILLQAACSRIHQVGGQNIACSSSIFEELFLTQIIVVIVPVNKGEIKF